MTTKYKLVQINNRNALHVPSCDQWIFICKDFKQGSNVEFGVAFDNKFKQRERLDWELWTNGGRKETIAFLKALVQLCAAKPVPKQTRSKQRRKS